MDRPPLPPFNAETAVQKVRLASHPPSDQSTLSTRRITLDPVDRLSGQAGLLRNLSDAHGLLAEHGPHQSLALAMSYTGTLSGLRSFSLRVSGYGHEGDQARPF
jgi:hypothetical protein